MVLLELVDRAEVARCREPRPASRTCRWPRRRRPCGACRGAARGSRPSSAARAPSSRRAVRAVRTWARNLLIGRPQAPVSSTRRRTLPLDGSMSIRARSGAAAEPRRPAASVPGSPGAQSLNPACAARVFLLLHDLARRTLAPASSRSCWRSLVAGRASPVVLPPSRAPAGATTSDDLAAARQKLAEARAAANETAAAVLHRRPPARETRDAHREAPGLDRHDEGQGAGAARRTPASARSSPTRTRASRSRYWSTPPT